MMEIVPDLSFFMFQVLVAKKRIVQATQIATTGDAAFQLRFLTAAIARQGGLAERVNCLA